MQGKDYLGNRTGNGGLVLQSSQTLHSLARFRSAPSSTWTYEDVSRNVVYLVTHLNATQLFLQTEGTMFPVITIWPPAMLLSKAS